MSMFSATPTHSEDIFKLYSYKNYIQNAVRFISSNNPPSLATIAYYNWQVAALTRCHKLSGCLVLDIPPLSSWWTATSVSSKAVFVTQIGAPPSQIGMLSILKIQLPNSNCLPLRLSSSVTTVRSLLGLEVSRALIYNGSIQCQQPWYLQNHPPRVMNIIETELQVRDKFWCAFKIGTYKMHFNFPGNRVSRPVEMAASVHDTVSNSSTMEHVFMLTSLPSGEEFTYGCGWTRIPFHHCGSQEKLVLICL